MAKTNNEALDTAIFGKKTLSNIFEEEGGSLLAPLDELLFGWLLWFIDIMFVLLLPDDLGVDCVEPGAWLDGLLADRLLPPLSLDLLLVLLFSDANSAKFKLPKLFSDGGDLLLDGLFALMFNKIGSSRACVSLY